MSCVESHGANTDCRWCKDVALMFELYKQRCQKPYCLGRNHSKPLSPVKKSDVNETLANVLREQMDAAMLTQQFFMSWIHEMELIEKCPTLRELTKDGTHQLAMVRDFIAVLLPEDCNFQTPTVEHKRIRTLQRFGDIMKHAVQSTVRYLAIIDELGMEFQSSMFASREDAENLSTCTCTEQTEAAAAAQIQ